MIGMIRREGPGAPDPSASRPSLSFNNALSGGSRAYSRGAGGERFSTPGRRAFARAAQKSKACCCSTLRGFGSRPSQRQTSSPSMAVKRPAGPPHPKPHASSPKQRQPVEMMAAPDGRKEGSGHHSDPAAGGGLGSAPLARPCRRRLLLPQGAAFVPHPEPVHAG